MQLAKARSNRATKVPPSQPPQPSILSERLAKIIETRNTNANALAKEAGLGVTAVYDIINRRSTNPSIRVVSAIARAARCDLNWLVGDDAGQETPIEARRSIEVVGAAETGAFRVGQTSMARDSNAKNVAGPFHPQYPGARHFALEVRDGAMDAARPLPLAYNSHALFVDMGDAGLQVEHGKIYAVRRSPGRIDGELFETIIRRAVIHGDRTELIADSHSPAYEKIIIPGRLSTSPDEKVHAFGLLYAVVGYYL